MNKSNEIELREARLRAKLRRAGYSLRKTRFRHPEVHATYPGYMIRDDDNRIVAGAWPHEFNLTLEEAEDFLQEIAA